MQDGLPSKEEILAEQRKTPFVTHENRGPTLANANIFWTTTESYISAGPVINIS